MYKNISTIVRQWRVSIAAFAVVAVFAFADMAHAQQRLENPLAFNTVAEFVQAALQALVIIALPIVGFFIVLSGFKFISAQGNQEKLSDAKRNFVYVILGAVFILGAWALSQLIAGTVEQLRA